MKKLSDGFVKELMEKGKMVIHYSNDVCHRDYSDDIIREYQDKINWKEMSLARTMTESFIKEFKDKLNLHWVYSAETFRKHAWSDEMKELFKNERVEIDENRRLSNLF